MVQSSRFESELFGLSIGLYICVCVFERVSLFLTWWLDKPSRLFNSLIRVPRSLSSQIDASIDNMIDI